MRDKRVWKENRGVCGGYGRAAEEGGGGGGDDTKHIPPSAESGGGEPSRGGDHKIKFIVPRPPFYVYIHTYIRTRARSESFLLSRIGLADT